MMIAEVSHKPIKPWMLYGFCIAVVYVFVSLFWLGGFPFMTCGLALSTISAIVTNKFYATRFVNPSGKWAAWKKQVPREQIFNFFTVLIVSIIMEIELARNIQNYHPYSYDIWLYTGLFGYSFLGAWYSVRGTELFWVKYVFCALVLLFGIFAGVLTLYLHVVDSWNLAIMKPLFFMLSMYFLALIMHIFVWFMLLVIANIREIKIQGAKRWRGETMMTEVRHEPLKPWTLWGLLIAVACIITNLFLLGSISFAICGFASSTMLAILVNKFYGVLSNPGEKAAERISIWKFKQNDILSSRERRLVFFTMLIAFQFIEVGMARDIQNDHPYLYDIWFYTGLFGAGFLAAWFSVRGVDPMSEIFWVKYIALVGVVLFTISTWAISLYLYVTDDRDLMRMPLFLSFIFLLFLLRLLVYLRLKK